jgi:hypothetical protein
MCWVSAIVSNLERGACGNFAAVDARESVMNLSGVVGLVLLLLVSGCAGLATAPPAAPVQNIPPRVDAEAVAPVGLPARLPSAPPPSVATKPGVASDRPASASGTSSSAASAGQTGPAVAKAPAKAPPLPAASAQPSSRESAPPGVAKPKVPPLDLASLELRLKETEAIGVLTKITLKNQVDDLLAQFRAFYEGNFKRDLAALRRSYDLLVLKVLSLLQDRDPALATAIAASREAIWGILSDPSKFAKI